MTHHLILLVYLLSLFIDADIRDLYSMSEKSRYLFVDTNALAYHNITPFILQIDERLCSPASGL